MSKNTFLFLLVALLLASCQSKQANNLPPNTQPQSTFPYTVNIPSGWCIIENDLRHYSLTTDIMSNEKHYVNPNLILFIPELQNGETKEDFINASLKGTIEHKVINKDSIITSYDVVAYECKQNSAHKEYLCYYAFIQTEDDFVVMNLSGDLSYKDDLKNYFYGFINEFAPNG